MTLEPCRHVWRYEQRNSIRIRVCIYCGSMWAFSEEPEDYGWCELFPNDEEAVE